MEGLVLGRDGTRFSYIGPLNASSYTVALNLICKAFESLKNQPVAVDIHEDKEELIKWMESIGFIRQRQFLRMYLDKNPYPGIMQNQFLISGPEFG